MKAKSIFEAEEEREIRRFLMETVRTKCAPMQKKARASMEEKYPLGMTPQDVANEIEGNIEDGGYTVEMPNINLSADSMQKAIIEGQGDEIKDMLVELAFKTEDPYFAAVTLELYDRICEYQHIEPAKMREQEQEAERMAEYQAKETQEHQEMDEKEEELERETAREEEVRSKRDDGIIKRPSKAIKEALGFDPER